MILGLIGNLFGAGEKWQSQVEAMLEIASFLLWLSISMHFDNLVVD